MLSHSNPTSVPSQRPSMQPTSQPSAQTVSTVLIASAVFSSNGQHVAVNINMATTDGHGKGRFPCNRMLSFAAAASHICSWQNASQLVIQDTIKADFSIGSTIALEPSSGLLVRWTAGLAPRPRTVLGDSSSTVLPPSSPDPPVIGSFAPVIISRCSDWHLDLSTATVLGNAGRSWKNITFFVQGDLLLSSTTLISSELNKQTKAQSLLVIPNSLLVSGERYIVQLALCNAMGGCAAKSMATLVSNSNNVAPVASILGLVGSMRPSDALVLTSNAYTLLCNGQRSSASLQYSWKVRLSGNSTWITNLLSVSKDKSKFSLPPQRLLPNQVYLVILSVRDSISNLSTTATSSVTVLPSDLVINITPAASIVTIRAGSRLLFNASASFDPDDKSTSLVFKWLCLSTGLQFCLLFLNASQSTVVVSANQAAINSTSILYLSISDSATKRNSTAAVQIHVIEPTKPLISLLPSTVNTSYMNVDQAVMLQSTVLATMPCNASWQVNPKDKISLESSAFPRKPIVGNRLTNVNLYLPAYSLYGGLTYIFTISCSSAAVSMEVTTNNPPQVGRLSVQPETGFALNTSFLLITDLWSDADLPLAYTFAYWSQTDVAYLTIRRRSEVSVASAILPSGDAKTGSVNVTVIAEDSYGASSDRRCHPLKVSPLPSVQAVSFVSYLLTMQNISTDELQNILSVATTVLNQVPCSAAPNCSALHRTGCHATANTCGACLAGFTTTGKSGDGNSPCISLSAISSYNATKNNRFCSSSSAGSACATWQFCNITTDTCKDQNKQCPSPSCSSKGRCVFQSSSTGIVLTSCPLISATCDALCYCNFGYAGEDCSLTTAEIASQQALRSQLMSSLTSVMTSTDSDVSSLANAATSLYTIIRNQYDVTAILASQVAGFIMNILSQAAPLSEQVSLKIASVLAPVNAALQSISSTNSSGDGAVGRAGNLSVALDAFQQLLDKEQQPFSVVYDTFRVSSQSIDTSQPPLLTGAGPVAYKVDIPLSEAERAARSLGQASTLPAVSILPTHGNSSTGSVFVSVVVLGQQQWKSNATSLVSDIVSVRASNVDFVDITLHSSNTGPQTQAVNYTITCPSRIRVKKNYTCIDSGYTAFLQCNGTAGSFFGVCPVLLATCSALNTASQDVTTAGSQCSAINSTGFGITCRCGLRGLDGTGVVAAGLVMRYVGSDFSSPFKSASSFNNAAAVGKAYIIIVLYSALWGCVAVVMIRLSWDWSGLQSEKGSKGNPTSTIVPLQQHADAAIDCGESGDGAESRKAQAQLTAYITAIFPAAFTSKSVLIRTKDEFLLHHLYVNFIFRLKQSAAPRLALVKMTTVQSFLLWLLALLYDLNYPSDDGSCVYFTVETSCLKRKYVLDNQHSYCKWVLSDNDFCAFAEPSFSLTTGMYISIMISIATCLGMEPLDYLMALLSAPTANDDNQPNATATAGQHVSPLPPVKSVQDIENLQMERTATTTAVVSPRRSSSIRRSLPSVAKVVHQNACDDIAAPFLPVFQYREQKRLSLHSGMSLHGSKKESLFEEIAFQRALLSGNHLMEFDEQWGLGSSTGRFLTKEYQDFCFRKRTVSMEALIQQELLDVRVAANGMLVELSTSSDAERGYEILQAFVTDLLGRHTPSSKIFATKAELDCEKEQAVSWSVKAAIAVFIFLLNGFFIYYTILKGYDKGLNWQMDYVQAWIVQLILDIFVFETVQCAWIHVIVPSLVSKEVRKANHQLQCMMDMSYYGSYRQHEEGDAAIFLNACEHLFVSHHLADAYPELLESKMVKTFANHLPGEVSNVWRDLLWIRRVHAEGTLFNFLKTVFISFVVQLAANVPVHVQSILIRVLEPTLLAALTFAFLLFLHKPVFLSILGFAMLMLGAMLVRDYFRARIADEPRPAQPQQSVANATPSAVVAETTEDADEIRDDILFHRLYPDADAKSDDSSVISDSDDSLPECLRDASDESLSVSDCEMNKLFGGSDSNSTSENSFVGGSMTDCINTGKHNGGDK